MIYDMLSGTFGCKLSGFRCGVRLYGNLRNLSGHLKSVSRDSRGCNTKCRSFDGFVFKVCHTLCSMDRGLLAETSRNHPPSVTLWLQASEDGKFSRHSSLRMSAEKILGGVGGARDCDRL